MGKFKFAFWTCVVVAYITGMQALHECQQLEEKLCRRRAGLLYTPPQCLPDLIPQTITNLLTFKSFLKQDHCFLVELVDSYTMHSLQLFYTAGTALLYVYLFFTLISAIIHSCLISHFRKRPHSESFSKKRTSESLNSKKSRLSDQYDRSPRSKQKCSAKISKAVVVHSKQRLSPRSFDVGGIQDNQEQFLRLSKVKESPKQSQLVTFSTAKTYLQKLQNMSFGVEQPSFQLPSKNIAFVEHNLAVPQSSLKSHYSYQEQQNFFRPLPQMENTSHKSLLPGQSISVIAPSNFKYSQESTPFVPPPLNSKISHTRGPLQQQSQPRSPLQQSQPRSPSQNSLLQRPHQNTSQRHVPFFLQDSSQTSQFEVTWGSRVDNTIPSAYQQTTLSKNQNGVTEDQQSSGDVSRFNKSDWNVSPKSYSSKLLLGVPKSKQKLNANPNSQKKIILGVPQQNKNNEFFYNL